jgi:metallopeptidase MepB
VASQLHLLRQFVPFTTYRYLTSSDMAVDKLRKPPQAPPVFTGTPTSIIDDTKHLIERSRKVYDQVVANVELDAATFANVLLPLAHVENAMTLEAHTISFYKDVSTDSKLRDASSEAQKLLDDFAIETSMHEDLYKLVDAVLKKNEDLDPESHQLLEKVHKDYIRNGLKLPAGPRRDRFKEIKKRLTQLTIGFRKNQNEENGGIWFFPQELEGVPEDVLSGLEKGGEENKGMLRLTFQYPDLLTTLRYAKNSETRKRFYIANQNKCNQNVPLFKEVTVLRDEAARLLGYPNHAAFRIEDKMAKKPETVDTFLGDLRSRLTADGQREIEMLKQLKKADLESRGESFDGKYFLWDHGFYNQLMLEKQYSVDQQKIAEYFPLQTTIRGMLEIFEHLFGLFFVEITGDERNKLADSGKGNDIVWHEDVQVFSVWDDDEQGSGFVGYLYLDLFPREGKYGNAANFNLQPVCMIFAYFGGQI